MYCLYLWSYDFEKQSKRLIFNHIYIGDTSIDVRRTEIFYYIFTLKAQPLQVTYSHSRDSRYKFSQVISNHHKKIIKISKKKTSFVDDHECNFKSIIYHGIRHSRGYLLLPGMNFHVHYRN